MTEQFPSSIVLCKNVDRKEESIVEREFDVFDPILSINNVSESKNKLMELEVQNINIVDVARSLIIPFCRE